MSRKIPKQSRLPISSIEILKFYKHQVKDELNEVSEKMDEDFNRLRKAITADALIDEIVGDEGLHSDVMKYLAPFALKYRNVVFSTNIFKGFSGPMKKMQLISLVSVLAGFVAYRFLGKKSD